MRDERFIRLHACDPKQPGRRLRLEREDGELAQLVEETTLPERVMSPNAQRVERHEHLWLTAVEARWLYDSLGELLPKWEAQNAADQAALDARAALAAKEQK